MSTAFHCRAYLLLEKELFKLRKLKLWGIEAYVIDDNFFEWVVTLTGLKGTIWQDGKFIITLKFNEHFNLEPPTVVFVTIPFHPNIDEANGSICIGHLKEWTAESSIPHLLLAVQNLLSDPVLEDAINTRAVNILRNSPVRYKQLVNETVMQSQRHESSFFPITRHHELRPFRLHEHLVSPTGSKEETFGEVDEKTHDKSKPHQHLNSPNQHKLSYEEYLRSWRCTGATKCDQDISNPFGNLLGERFSHADYGLLKNDLDMEVSRQLSEHRMLMFGQFKKDVTSKRQLERLKADKIKLLKDIHANKPITNLHISLPSSPVELLENNGQNDGGDEDELNVLEAKELLNWTDNLPI